MDNVWEVLEHQGRRIRWLARATGFSEDLLLSIKAGRRRASPRFRERCALVLGVPESLLFHADTSKRDAA